MADFPRQRRHRAGGPGVVREAGQAREEPGRRKVRHDRRRWPARRLSGSLTPLENTLLTTRRYVLHTSPHAVLPTRGCTSLLRASPPPPLLLVLFRFIHVYQRYRGGTPARFPHGERVRYLDASPSARTLRIIRKATSPTSGQIGEDGSLVASRFQIAAEERLRSPSRAVTILQSDLPSKAISIEYSSKRARKKTRERKKERLCLRINS